jgi:hypothetical protein
LVDGELLPLQRRFHQSFSSGTTNIPLAWSNPDDVSLAKVKYEQMGQVFKTLKF